MLRTAFSVTVILVAVLFPSTLFGQTGDQNNLPSPIIDEAPSLRFEHLAQEQGLAQVSAMGIHQDSQGFLWIATQGGLHRYDGTGFKLYTSVPFDTTSLSENWIWNASEASNGDMWVTAEMGGVNRLNRKTDTFTHYLHNPDDSTSIPSDRTFHALEDSDGNLWVTFLGGGTPVSKMKASEDGVFKHFVSDHNDSTTVSAGQAFFMTEDNSGHMWIGTSNGVSRIDIETDEVTRFVFDPERERSGYGFPSAVLGQYIPPGTDEVVWLATGNGLVKLNPETREFERYLIEPNAPGDHNPMNYIHMVAPDPNIETVLWVSGPGTGLARFDINSEQFTSYRNNPLNPNSLSDNNANMVMTDRSGTMWVGTANAGISKFNPGSVNFVHLTNDPEDDQSLAAGNVWGVYEDREGTMWVGSDQGQIGNVLTQFDAATGRVTRHRRVANNDRSLPGGSYRAFVEDSRGNFYVGGGGGFSRFDRRNGRVTRLELERIPENQGRTGVFTAIPWSEDPDIFWLGTFVGAQKFDSRTDEYTQISFKQDSADAEPAVWDIFEAVDGTLWAGTTDGLYTIDPENLTTELVAEHDPRDPSTLSDNSLVSLLERPSEPGVLWITTTGEGLNRYDTRTGEAKHYFRENGLPDNTIYGILEDDSGTLWMSTNNGISNLDPDTNTFKTYGLDAGLIALEYNQNAYWKGSGGVLYFGHVTGVTAFVPERLQTNRTPPQVALTGLKIFNNPVKPGPDSPLTERIEDASSITLSHDENEISFEFVALHFANPENNSYAYMLEGHDDDWINIGNSNTASFTNLKHGNYTFRVKAANADGVWNEEGIALNVRITPPWWRTWWAYLGYALLFAAGVFTIDRLQRRKIARKEIERAQIREIELKAEGENRRREDAERLSAMGRAITSTLSTREIIDTVYENVNALVDAAIFGIGIYDPENNSIHFPATKENGETLKSYSYSLDDPSRPAVWCFKNEKEFVVGDYAAEYDKYLPATKEPVAGDAASSIIYMPLLHQDKAVGVITTQSFKKDAYSDYHKSVLRTLASYAAIAIDNADAYRRLSRTLSDLKATQQQLVQSEKMASLGTLTAGIAHEIKNPLNFINNFAEVNQELAQELRDAVASGEDINDLIADLEQNATVIAQHGKRADSIVRSMMQHASGGKGHREMTDVNALVAEHTDLAYHGKRAQLPSLHATVERDFSETTGSVEMIPQEIGRVLLNVIGNAFDAIYEHGTGSSFNGAPPTIKVATRRVGQGIEIKVSDNGPGIPDHIRDRIFEPFFTTKPTGLGTGLGLSLSHDIVTQGHGGTFNVESSPGGGATFIITLP